MKIPFSYGVKNNSFPLILGISLTVHALALGAAGFLFSPAKYAVQEAPSSMEVIMIEKPKPQTKPQIKENIVETPKEALQKIPIQQKKAELEKPKSVIIPPLKGALPQAKPDYLRNPAPVYPEAARRNGWEGLVLLKVLVSKEGACEKISVVKSSGHSVLDKSALRAVKDWKFLPARAGAMSFSSWIKVPVRFVLVDKNN